MKIVLKPCPHCAGTAEVLNYDGDYYATCTKCGSTGSTGFSEENASINWNIRSPALQTKSKKAPK